MAERALHALDSGFNPHLFLVAAPDLDPERGISRERSTPEPGQLGLPLVAAELGDSLGFRTALAGGWPETECGLLKRAGPVDSGAQYLDQLRALFADQVRRLPESVREDRVPLEDERRTDVEPEGEREVWVAERPGWIRVQGRPYWVFPILALPRKAVDPHLEPVCDEAGNRTSLIDHVVRETLSTAAQSFSLELEEEGSTVKIAPEENCSTGGGRLRPRHDLVQQVPKSRGPVPRPLRDRVALL